jgi:DNA-binding HxlR family transcriptional regulator
VILKEAIGGSGLYTRWSGGILLLLDHGPTRQSALKRALVGITPRALSQALKELQEQRLVERIVTPGSPPAVHYQLSDWGERVALFMDGFVVPIRGQLPGP